VPDQHNIQTQGKETEPAAVKKCLKAAQSNMFSINRKINKETTFSLSRAEETTQCFHTIPSFQKGCKTWIGCYSSSPNSTSTCFEHCNSKILSTQALVTNVVILLMVYKHTGYIQGTTNYPVHVMVDCAPLYGLPVLGASGWSVSSSASGLTLHNWA
jgi:hypothetical protein